MSATFHLALHLYTAANVINIMALVFHYVDQAVPLYMMNLASGDDME